jgi:hypothetical protein
LGKNVFEWRHFIRKRRAGLARALFELRFRESKPRVSTLSMGTPAFAGATLFEVA